MNEIIFNGKSTKDFGIVVEKFPDREIPARDYSSVHVPGRNGDVLIDNGSFQNVKRVYEIAFADECISFFDASEIIRNWMSSYGYARLEDTYEPGYFREAFVSSSSSITNIWNKGARYKIEFTCKPQRWLKAGYDIPLNKVNDMSVKFISPNAEGYPIITVKSGSMDVLDTEQLFIRLYEDKKNKGEIVFPAKYLNETNGKFVSDPSYYALDFAQTSALPDATIPDPEAFKVKANSDYTISVGVLGNGGYPGIYIDDVRMRWYRV